MHMLKGFILIVGWVAFFVPGTAAHDGDKGGAAWQDLAPETYPLSRQWVDSAEFPWRTIGRVNLAGRGHCSGVLVAEHVVLTSAHCLWNRRSGRWYPSQYITFVAGAELDGFQGYSKVSGYTVANGFSPALSNEFSAVKDDWALLKLKKPLGRPLGFIALGDHRKLSVGQHLIQAGYRSDRAQVLTVERNCRLAQWYDEQRVFSTSCHTLDGDSGGPVLIEQDNRWLLVGIHRGRTVNNQSLVVSSGNIVTVLESSTDH